VCALKKEMKPLEDRVAIVTGAGRGIGRSIALALAGAGARMALAARTEMELHAVQAEIESLGGQAAAFPTDMSREADIVRLVQQTVERFGGLDILVNNAGFGTFGPLEQTTTEQWDQIMAVNARGPFILCREALPYLKRSPLATTPLSPQLQGTAQQQGTTEGDYRRRAFIINISSVVGVKGYINQAAYTASKHALLGMSKSLAREVQGDGIRVHVICPGGVDTGLIGDARPDLDRSVLIKPEEIADVVLFLVTRQGNAVIDQVDVRREVSTPWA
jgi:3-oxoacyl-[acyl-carrier protein] reductase